MEHGHEEVPLGDLLHEAAEGRDVVVGLGLVTEVEPDLGEVLDLLVDALPLVLVGADEREVSVGGGGGAPGVWLAVIGARP